MKKAFLTYALVFAFVAMLTKANGQSPGGFNYQAVARNRGGAPLTNQNVAVRFTIRDSSATGLILYRETHNLTTNQQGLFAAKIGMGTTVQGTFADIPWATGEKYLEVETDVAGGAAYTSMGNTQLLSVPYAMYANPPGRFCFKGYGNATSTPVYPGVMENLSFTALSYDNGFNLTTPFNGFVAPESGVYHVDFLMNVFYSMVDGGKFSDVNAYLVKGTGEVQEATMLQMVLQPSLVNGSAQNTSTLSLSSDIILQKGETILPQFKINRWGSSPFIGPVSVGGSVAVHKVF